MRLTKVKKTIIFLILVAIAISAFANTDVVVTEANTHYQNHEYQQALDSFLKLNNEGYINTDLFYNIGNCYYRSGQIGNAILYMKKALKVDSANRKAKRNLEFLLTQTKDKQTVAKDNLISKFFASLISNISLNSLAFISLIIIGMIIFIIHIIIHRFAQKDRVVPYFIITVLAVFLILVGIISNIKLSAYDNISTAVLLADTAIGFSGPNTEFTRVFTIHEGMIFTIEKEQNGWALIKLSNGIGGWIVADTFAKVSIR